MEQVITSIVSTGIVLLGYYLKRHPDNGMFGFRIPWIEGDRVAEARMNAHSAPLLALAGIAGLVGSLFDSERPSLWLAVPLIAVAIYSAGYSIFVIFRRPGRR